MKSTIKKIAVFMLIIMILFIISIPSFAETGSEKPQTNEVTVTETSSDGNVLSAKAIAAGIAIALAATGGAIAMGIAIAKSADSISRQPEAEGKIRTTLMLGLVFIETAIIYALIVAILIIFVL